MPKPPKNSDKNLKVIFLEEYYSSEDLSITLDHLNIPKKDFFKWYNDDKNFKESFDDIRREKVFFHEQALLELQLRNDKEFHKLNSILRKTIDKIEALITYEEEKDGTPLKEKREYLKILMTIFSINLDLNKIIKPQSGTLPDFLLSEEEETE